MKNMILGITLLFTLSCSSEKTCRAELDAIDPNTNTNRVITGTAENREGEELFCDIVERTHGALNVLSCVCE